MDGRMSKARRAAEPDAELPRRQGRRFVSFLLLFSSSRSANMSSKPFSDIFSFILLILYLQTKSAKPSLAGSSPLVVRVKGRQKIASSPNVNGLNCSLELGLTGSTGIVKLVSSLSYVPYSSLLSLYVVLLLETDPFILSSFLPNRKINSPSSTLGTS